MIRDIKKIVLRPNSIQLYSTDVAMAKGYAMHPAMGESRKPPQGKEITMGLNCSYIPTGKLDIWANL